MKMNKKWIKLFVLLIVAIAISGCSTIDRQQMTYLGDEKKTTNVVGKATHIDLLGIGANGDAFAELYREAVNDSFRSSPPGTTELNSVKAFREYKFWPQALGVAGMLLGGLFIVEGGAETGLALYIGGTVLSGINTYDLILISEPNN